MVHGCRSAQSRRFNPSSLPFGFIYLPSCREDTTPLSQLLSSSGGNTHGSAFQTSFSNDETNMEKLAFVVPFGAKPSQCYDAITPHDMYSSLPCAFSGAFLISGGLSIAVWSKCLAKSDRALLTSMVVFIRALSMHLQICWDVSPGTKFFYWAQGLGWGVIAALFTATITVTGVSFRFGDVCHVNSKNSMKDFWGPLLAIAGAATIVQLAT